MNIKAIWNNKNNRNPNLPIFMQILPLDKRTNVQKKKNKKKKDRSLSWISSLFSRKIKLQLLHNLALKLLCTSLRSTTPLRRINASHEERLSVCDREGVRESYENTRGPYYEHWDKASSTYSTGPPIYEIRLGPVVSPTRKDGVQGTKKA